jgi:hypothetical protein
MKMIVFWMLQLVHWLKLNDDSEVLAASIIRVITHSLVTGRKIWHFEKGLSVGANQVDDKKLQHPLGMSAN